MLGIRQFADTLGCTLLVESAEKYVQQYFHDVSMCEEYLLLSAAELLDIVKRDELHVLSEEQVCIYQLLTYYSTSFVINNFNTIVCSSWFHCVSFFLILFYFLCYAFLFWLM